MPWHRVGPGWVLAQYWPGRFADPGQAIAAPETLYLFSPAGHRYQVRRWAATKNPLYLIDWSGDKNRALLYDQASNRMEQLTLTTGRVSQFRLPSGVLGFTTSYTRPTGQGLLAFRSIRGGSQLVRLSVTGRLVKVLASGPRDGTAVYSSSGRTIAVAGAKGLQLVSTNGGVIRKLPVPRTGSSGCRPARWWSARTILASCVARRARRSRLWLVPASGARPRPLTPQHGSHSPDPGDFNAWRTPAGLFLQAATRSGHVLIFQQRPNGAVRAVRVPGSVSFNWIARAHGSRLLVNQVAPCALTDSLLWFNPATGREQSLIKHPRGRAGTIGFTPYGPPSADILIFVACGANNAALDGHSPGATGIAPGLRVTAAG